MDIHYEYDRNMAEEIYSFVRKTEQGFASCRGVNFRVIIIAGKRAREAAKWLQDRLHDGISIFKETYVILMASRLFHVTCQPFSEVGLHIKVFYEICLQ